MQKRAITVVMLRAISLSGCSSTEVMAPTVSVSVGQQLIDLKKARDAGALTESDYRRERQELIESVR